VLCRLVLAWSLAEVGRFDAAMGFAHESVNIARRVNHPFDQVNALFTLGLVHLRRGELGAAIAPLEQSLEICDTTEVSSLRPASAGALGLAYARTGRAAQGVTLLNQALSIQTSLKIQNTLSLLRGWQAEAYLRAGDAERARDFCDEALRLSGRYGE